MESENFQEIHNIRYFQKIGQREEKREEESMVPPNCHTFLPFLSSDRFYVDTVSKTVKIRDKI
jgi:hypothetical protein